MVRSLGLRPGLFEDPPSSSVLVNVIVPLQPPLHFARAGCAAVAVRVAVARAAGGLRRVCADAANAPPDTAHASQRPKSLLYNFDRNVLLLMVSVLPRPEGLVSAASSRSSAS